MADYGAMLCQFQAMYRRLAADVGRVNPALSKVFLNRLCRALMEAKYRPSCTHRKLPLADEFAMRLRYPPDPQLERAVSMCLVTMDLMQKTLRPLGRRFCMDALLCLNADYGFNETGCACPVSSRRCPL